MEQNPNARLLRIYIGETDKIGHQPLYEAIVYEARKQGLSGATVVRGVMGFGAGSHIHTSKLFEISTELPVIIEIADSEEKIMLFVKTVDHLFNQANSGGLITLENVKVFRYKAKD